MAPITPTRSRPKPTHHQERLDCNLRPRQIEVALALGARELAAYIEANVAAVREVDELIGGAEAALANHLIMGPLILARAGLSGDEARGAVLRELKRTALATQGPLLEQLADPGRMVIPVGDQYVQQLQLITKSEGKIEIQIIEQVRFVNLIGDHGWAS